MNNQVKQLRAENRHEEAYKLTKEELLRKPADIWAKRLHSWSIYYLIKKHVQAGEAAQARHFLEEFEALEMPKDEVLLYERMGYFYRVLDAGYLQAKQLVAEGKFAEAYRLQVEAVPVDAEQLAWTCYYLLRSHQKTGKPDTTTVAGVLGEFRQLVQPTKKLVYKLLLQEVTKLKPECWYGSSSSEYMEFLGLFGQLEEEDYQDQVWEGKKIISLAERLHIAYSKALLSERADAAKIHGYLAETVEGKLERYPAMQYVPFFKAKLLLGTGDRESGLRAFLPFARKKSGEFWVWQVYAEAYEDHADRYFSSLCKAMTCRAKPAFLSGIRERMIAFLVKEGRYDEAKYELDQLVAIREKEGWGLRSLHREYLGSDWYAQSSPKAIDYASHTEAAESLLYAGSGEECKVVVVHINKAKKLFGFITEDKREGFGKYRTEPVLWGIYQMNGSFQEGNFFEVIRMAKQESPVFPLVRAVSGKFTKQSHQSFGFAEGVFVDPAMVSGGRLVHGDRVVGKALLMPVKGKKDWKWRMVSIEKEG